MGLPGKRRGDTLGGGRVPPLCQRPARGRRRGPAAMQMGRARCPGPEIRCGGSGEEVGTAALSTDPEGGGRLRVVGSAAPREEVEFRRSVNARPEGGGEGRACRRGVGRARFPEEDAATPGRRSGPPPVRSAPGGGGAFRTPFGACAPEGKCGDTREEEKCRRFCYGPRGGGRGPARNLICRRLLPSRST